MSSGLAENADHRINLWSTRGGSESAWTGMQLVHVDGANQPLLGPYWPSKSDSLLLPPKSRAQAAERRELMELWVWEAHRRVSSGLGLGYLAADPDAIPLLPYFYKLPTQLLRQRDVMQCMRGEGFVTRYDHGVDVALTAGLLAIEMGLSREMVELAYIGGLLHDIGHVAFSHSSESAIEDLARNIARNEGVDLAWEDYEHSDNSGSVVAHLPWARRLTPRQSEVQRLVKVLVWGVSNHSWHMRHGDMPDPSAGILADILGMADRISYAITDTVKDCVHAGRIEWNRLPGIIPESFELGKVTSVEAQELRRLGPYVGGEVLHDRLRKTFVHYAGAAFRRRGVVGLPHFVFSALDETRNAASSRMFNLLPHKNWETKLNAFVSTVVGHRYGQQMRHGGDPDEALRLAHQWFSSRTETEVIAYAQRHRLQLQAYDLLEDDIVPFTWKDVAETPCIGPSRVARLLRSAASKKPQQRNVVFPEFKRKLVSLDELVPVNFPLRLRRDELTNLTTTETMDLLTYLSTPRGRPLRVVTGRADKPSWLKIPAGQGVRNLIAEYAHGTLEAALREVVQKDVEPVADMHSDESNISHSRGVLRKYFELAGHDPVATLRAYSREQSRQEFANLEPFEVESSFSTAARGLGLELANG